MCWNGELLEKSRASTEGQDATAHIAEKLALPEPNPCQGKGIGFADPTLLPQHPMRYHTPETQADAIPSLLRRKPTQYHPH